MSAARDARQDLLRIFRAAIAAVDPTALTYRYLIDQPRPAGHLLVVGVGKAAARMAAGCEAALGAHRLSGMVIAADGCDDVDLASIAVHVAGHPLPDQRGVRATRALCEVLAAAAADRPVLCLISGGASSLLISPRSPLALAEKMDVNRLLLECGAEITEVNTVRKHLSAVKGGGLLRLTRARPLTTLVLSDVIGDDPGVIGSGPTTPDATTFADALGVLRKYAIIDRAAAVGALLERGAHGEVPETVKAGDPECDGATTVVIGNNRLALSAAAAEASRLGYEAWIDPEPLRGETTDAARLWVRSVRGRLDRSRACVIAGGETTVVVRGRGRGGRNQEFALALLDPLAGCSGTVLSAGTDGIDGPTDAAGAFVDGESLQRARAAHLDASAALAENDSYGFFDRLGDLLRCGPTGTNVMDIKLAIGRPSFE